VDEAADPYAGLLGPIIITTPDNANDDGSPKDVDREYVLSFAILDEGGSFLLETNMARFLPRALSRNATRAKALMEDDGFKEANLKHSINGCALGGAKGVAGRGHVRVEGCARLAHTQHNPVHVLPRLRACAPPAATCTATCLAWSSSRAGRRACT
jgi:hypothetical protein